MIPWILISIAILIVILFAIFIVKNKGKKHKTDYYAFFIIGLIWTIFGMFSYIRYKEFNGLFAIGIIFLILGLVHKKEWKKNHITWSQLDKKEKKLKLIIIGVGVLLLFLGIVVFYLMNS